MALVSLCPWSAHSASSSHVGNLHDSGSAGDRLRDFISVGQCFQGVLGLLEKGCCDVCGGLVLHSL